VENPSGVIEPTVEWKQAPLSAVASCLSVSDKCYVLYFELNIMNRMLMFIRS
jgi:hypothetical protein